MKMTINMLAHTFKVGCDMKSKIKLLLVLATIGGAFSSCDTPSTRTDPVSTTQIADKSAKEIRGASPYIEIENEPAPKLVVDPPLPDALAQGIVWIQWRVENMQIAPLFGKGALNVSPRVGHLHIQVDDLPWWWADASNINTKDLAGLPPGQHRIHITLVNANHEAVPGQSRIVTLTVPESARSVHSH
jgi:hypothetical protein